MPATASRSRPHDAAAFWISRKQLGTLSAQEETTFREWLTHPENATAFAGNADGGRHRWISGRASGYRRNARRRTCNGAGTDKIKPATMGKRGNSCARRHCGNSFFVLAYTRPSIPSLCCHDWGSTYTDGVECSQHARADADRIRHTKGATSYDIAGRRIEHRARYGDNLFKWPFPRANARSRYFRDRLFFMLAKDKHRPFVVTARDRRITAVGTAFDVRIDQTRVRVALIEGRVVVDPVRPTGIAWLVPALATQTLEAGQELVATSSGSTSVNTADIERSTEWQQDQVLFRDDTLEGAIAEMNRYSESPIVISDPKIAGLRISGVFGASRQDNFLAAITTYYPLSAERQPSGAITLSWRQSDQ